MNLTDNEIIKALENCGNVGECQKCPLNEMGQGISLCIPHLTQSALDLINRQKTEKDDLFYKLEGVMHSVDKWLDGDELKQDEVNRAATMREKTLQIVEQKQVEIERLQTEGLQINETFMNFVNKSKAEEIKEFAKFIIDKAENGVIHTIDVPELVERWRKINENQKGC